MPGGLGGIGLTHRPERRSLRSFCCGSVRVQSTTSVAVGATNSISTNILQAYAIEKCRIEARKAGNSLTEQTVTDGTINLTIQVSRGAQ